MLASRVIFAAVAIVFLGLPTLSTVPAQAGDTQVCIWEGRAPACNGKCRPGYTPVLRNKAGDGRHRCITGTKVKCCKTSDIIIRGTAPLCNGKCKPGEERLGDSKKGAKGKKCRTGKAAICRINMN